MTNSEVFRYIASFLFCGNNHIALHYLIRSLSSRIGIIQNITLFCDNLYISMIYFILLGSSLTNIELYLQKPPFWRYNYQLWISIPKIGEIPDRLSCNCINLVQKHFIYLSTSININSLSIALENRMHLKHKKRTHFHEFFALPLLDLNQRQLG